MDNISDITCINTSTIRSAIRQIRSTIEEGTSAVEQIKGSLDEDVWKAQAKNTLKAGYDQLINFPDKDIKTILTTMETVCGKIDDLKQIVGEINSLTRKEKLTLNEKESLDSKVERRNALARDIRGMCN